MITESQKKQVLNKVRLETLIGESIQLKQKGKEHVGLCPFHQEKTPSFSVNEDNQFYYCFGCGANGNAYSWAMNYLGMTFPQAHEYLGGERDADAPPKPKPAEQKPIEMPESDPPSLEPEFTDPQGELSSKADHYHVYKAADRVMQIVARWDAKGNQKKEFRQYSYNDGRWRWKSIPHSRPLYNLDKLAKKPDAPVLIVEGEMTADKASYFFRKHVIVTWAGGTNAFTKTDWSPIYGRQLVIWPDADGPGRAAFKGKTNDQGEYVPGIIDMVGPYVPEIKLIDTKKLPKGYDLGDFRNEGKMIADVAEYAKENVQVIEWEPAPDAPESAPEPEMPAEPMPNGFPSWPEKPPENQACDSLLPLYKGHYCWDTESEQTHIYTGTHWIPIKTSSLQEIVKADLTKALSVSSKGFSMGYLRGVTSMLAISFDKHTWSSDYNLLPLANGVLDIADRHLAPLGPEQPFNWSLPYEYDPQADCPTVKEYIQWVADDDPEVVMLLQAWLNCCLTGRSDVQKFLELVGPGGTGKSTFLNLCSLIVGDQNTFTTELKQLSSNRFETSGLYGKRLVLISDSERYGGDVSVLKAITGGDIVRCELKGGARFDYIPRCMAILASNEAVQTSDHTSGLARRRLTLKMTKRVDKDKKDPFLMQKFKSEMAGVVNWALELSHQEVTDIINNPGSKAQSSIDAITVESNSLAAWLDENVIYKPDDKTWCYLGARNSGHDDYHDKLYPNYVKYCDDVGYKHLAHTRFMTILMDLCDTNGLPGVRKKRTADGVVVKRVRVRNNNDFSLPTTLTKQTIEA